MESSISQALQRALAYLQSGQAELAQSLLTEVVKRQPDSEEGWLLLSQAVSEQRQKIDCLQHVLRLNPGNIEAQTQLRQLLTPAASASESAPTRSAVVSPRSDMDALRAAA